MNVNKLFSKFISTVLLFARNKVIRYTITRYIISLISFVSSMIVAAKLGPYYLGIWGFCLLLRRYFQIINCGIPDASTVLLVQNKNNKKKANDYETNGIFLTGILCVAVCLIALYYCLFGISIIRKYELGNLFYFICAIAILTYLNDLFFKIYRVKGQMFEFTFYQSIVQVLVFLIVFVVSGKILIYSLLLAYLLGNLLSFILFVKGGKLTFRGKVNIIDGKFIFQKGVGIFFYNFLFYMILISTQTIISSHYSIKEFGYFTFSYTLASAVIVLLDAITSLIVPKLIDKFNSKDIVTIESTLKLLRINYIYVSYGLMCFLIVIFFILLTFYPQYSTTFQVINFTSLTVVLSTNSFGYSTLLMARNKERIIAIISLIALTVNIVLALFLIFVIKVEYQYVVLATLISYSLHSYLCVLWGKKELYKTANITDALKECFPIRILIPFLIIMIITIFNVRYLIIIPFLIFLLLNFEILKNIILSFRKILWNPNIIDVK